MLRFEYKVDLPAKLTIILSYVCSAIYISSLDYCICKKCCVESFLVSRHSFAANKIEIECYNFSFFFSPGL